MLSTYAVSMKINIRRYSKSSKLGMISRIYYERCAHSKESSPIRRIDLSGYGVFEYFSVIAISVISVSSDSSEESVGTSTGRVILFASDTEFDLSEDPSSDHIPPLLATLSFLSSTDDSLDNDILDTPPSPTHGTPFIETTLPTQSSPVASDFFGFFTDALSDSLSSRLSSNHSLPTPSSGMRPSHYLCSLVLNIHRLSVAISDRPSHDSSSTSPSRKRSRSPAASILLSLPTLGALSYARADLLPSPKWIRSSETVTDLEGYLEDSFEPYVPTKAGLGVDFEDESFKLSRCRGTYLEMDVDVMRSDGIDIDPEIQAEIDECIAYADSLKDRGIDARVVVEAIDREEIETGIRGPVEVRVNRLTHPVVADDIPKPV
ncbi:hypothetical protein Tco_1523699 [Tanacetum coccineum]